MQPDRDIRPPAQPPKENEVDESSDESFPASDPPSWSPTHTGAPDRHPTPRQDEPREGGREERRDPRPG